MSNSKKPGRKSDPDLTYRFMIRCSVADRALWEGLAAAGGLDLSSWARHVLRGTTARKRAGAL